MPKPFIPVANVLLICLIFLGTARAQQSQPPATQQNPPPNAAQAPAANPAPPPAPRAQQAPAAQPGQTAAPKFVPDENFKTEKDRNSYAIGMAFGASLRKGYVDVDPEILLQGLKAGLADAKTLLTEEEAHAAIMEVQAEAHKKQEEKMQQAAEENKKEGEAFLAANKTKEGVVTLPSGLQYKILQAGTGPIPTATDTVVCNYRGTFIDGKEFDSSYKHGQPATFPVSGVIKGWTEALQLMPVGSKWELYLPSDLAYGARGQGQVIGPNSTLIFEVELVSIQPKNK
jgi:FKBP-type peptidyl-prolyl cis-trans isomerase FklB